jgi:hypothetical protein
MLNKINVSDKVVPVIFLFLLIASFGLLIPKLGYYWDDWPVIFMTQTQGNAGFWDFYQYDRPFSAWTYILTAPIIGTRPIGWHIFSLLLRWLTVVFVWVTLRKVWPNKPRQAFWIALLFSVYPIFNQQPVAVAYSQHWTCYLFYFVSIYLMLLSQEQKRFYYHLVFISGFFSLVQMVTMEYFLGLELFRPFILWAYHHYRRDQTNKLIIFKKVFSAGWPYVALLGAYAVWRVFFLELAGTDPNNPVLLKQLFLSPIQVVIDLLQKGFQDFIYFLTAWFVAISPIDIDFRRPFFLASLSVVIIVSVLLWLALKQYRSPLQTTANTSDNWHLQAMLFGVIAAVFGTLPVWMIGRQASLGLYGNRFGLAAMFGLSIALVGLLEWLSNRTVAKNTAVCILIGMAVHFHLFTAKAYQDSWEKQQRVYWQLSWRAPYIEPETAIISDGEIFQYVGNYSTSMGIALLYPPTDKPQEMAYWFFSMARGLYTKVEEMIAGVPLTDSLRNYSFEGNSKDSLLLYLPAPDQCLKILKPNETNDKDIPGLLQPVIPISNLDRIEKDFNQEWGPPESIFGKEPEHTWCYYFEKAELASQYKDWEEVISLYQVAEQQGYKPLDAVEFLPLLDALLRTNELDKAYQLSVQMKRLTDRRDDQICKVWINNIENQDEYDIGPVFEKIKEQVNCFD